jgi:hypothetical protein
MASKTLDPTSKYFECAVHINAAKLILEEAEQALLDDLDLRAASQVKLAITELTDGLVCLHKFEHARNEKLRSLVRGKF